MSEHGACHGDDESLGGDCDFERSRALGPWGGRTMCGFQRINFLLKSRLPLEGIIGAVEQIVGGPALLISNCPSQAQARPGRLAGREQTEGGMSSTRFVGSGEIERHLSLGFRSLLLYAAKGSDAGTEEPPPAIRRAQCRFFQDARIHLQQADGALCRPRCSAPEALTLGLLSIRSGCGAIPFIAMRQIFRRRANCAGLPVAQLPPKKETLAWPDGNWPSSSEENRIDFRSPAVCLVHCHGFLSTGCDIGIDRLKAPDAAQDYDWGR